MSNDNIIPFRPSRKTADQGPSGSESADLADLRRKADAGDTDAQLELGMYLLQNEDTTAEGLDYIRGSAESGNPEAQTEWGFLHAIGAEVPLDPEQSVQWYTKAAEQGNKEA